MCQFVFYGILTTSECFQQFKASVLETEILMFFIFFVEVSNAKSWK